MLINRECYWIEFLTVFKNYFKANLRTRREVNDFGIVVVMIGYTDGLSLLHTVWDDFGDNYQGETETKNITLRIRPQVIVPLHNHYLKITTRTKLINPHVITLLESWLYCLWFSLVLPSGTSQNIDMKTVLVDVLLLF